MYVPACTTYFEIVKQHHCFQPCLTVLCFHGHLQLGHAFTVLPYTRKPLGIIGMRFFTGWMPLMPTRRVKGLIALCLRDTKVKLLSWC